MVSHYPDEKEVFCIIVFYYVIAVLHFKAVLTFTNKFSLFVENQQDL